MFKRIDHVELVPADFEKTIAFYTEVIGFSVEVRAAINRPPVSELAFLKLGDTRLELFSVAGARTVATDDSWRVGCRRFALEVEDTEKAVAYLRSKGVAITREPTKAMTSIIAEFEDPNGVRVELKQSLS